MPDSRVEDVLDDILALVDDGTGGSVPLRYPDSYNLLAVGEGVFPRSYISASGATGTGSLRLSYFTAQKTETTTQVRTISGSTAATLASVARVGLYEIAGNGAGTLVASTANDVTLWTATITAYTRSWSVPYAKVAGQRYAVGVLVVTAGTAPTLIGAGAPEVSEPGVAPRLVGVSGGHADLPASFETVANTAVRLYAVVLP